MIDSTSGSLLRRHVADGSHHGAGLSAHLTCWHIRGRFTLVSRFDQFGETEVEDLYAAVSRYENVIWFEIAMDDAAFVSSRKPASDLHRVFGRAPRREHGRDRKST